VLEIDGFLLVLADLDVMILHEENAARYVTDGQWHHKVQSVTGCKVG